MQLRIGAAARPGRLWGMTRHGLPFLIGAICLWAVSVRLGPGALQGLGPAIGQLAPGQWLAALAATAISFWALGRYDVILHRHFRTLCAPRQASLSGAAAIAIGQTVGFGVISGALVRWRLLPDLRFTEALRVSVGVAVSFLLGLAFSLGLAGLILRPEFLGAGASVLLLFIFIFISLFAFLYPVPTWRSHRIRLPGIVALWQLAGLAAVDTVFAALALWALLPAGTDPGLALVIPAYMLALGAALMTGTPGGVGPFELVLLGLLPAGPEIELLAGIVAFRLVYYALPACLAALLLCRPFPRGMTVARQTRALGKADLTGTHRAELGVCRQNGALLLSGSGARLPVLRTGQCLCGVFAPLSGSAPENLDLLRRTAKQENRLAVFYKTDARLAAHARGQGWRALHVADEQIVDPATFTIEGPARRQLRRKLRKAQRAGVQVRRPATPPFGALQRIDRAWQSTRGGARGLSMGRFCATYLRDQALWVAEQDGRAIAFLSCHTGDTEWCLDLMRAGNNAPDGTMHMLVAAAIDAARASGCARFSLAALPPGAGFMAWVMARLGETGLRQFKTSFAPRAEPLYALAPSWPATALALADIGLSIRRPDTNPAQEDHEEIAFAHARQT